jgi:hypothetical protein
MNIGRTFPSLCHYAQHEQGLDKVCMKMQPLARSAFCTSPTIEVDLMAAL